MAAGKLSARAAVSGRRVAAVARMGSTGGRAALVVRAEAPGQPSWLPGAKNPAYLDGSLPGDFGWDPLGLGSDPETLKWYGQAELVHARFAMLGAAGILLPEAAAKIGISWPGAGVSWVDAGKFEYFTDYKTLWTIQLFLMGWAETRRYLDYKSPGSMNQDPAFTGNKLPDGNSPGYPGGIFDPFGWSKGDLKTLQLKEIKNGRLAMFSMLGFYGQQAVTGMTPLEAWAKHVADPWGSTVWSNELVACASGAGLCSRGGEIPEISAAFDVLKSALN
eukprot:CAMPEP_0119122224 /NCGR_PEP_ID=MMETSP1310-20130426/2546_1 /TAXON_ID=464262 /ORGANISM="Genus nov. species nov., Strain RCC2339" /LENGTH=275 /DNA_ID=CAMNT_0007111847 /DNA_START=33 /DNA_END=860 /DNA_ORIENTATION=-